MQSNRLFSPLIPALFALLALVAGASIKTRLPPLSALTRIETKAIAISTASSSERGWIVELINKDTLAAALGVDPNRDQKRKI